MKIKILFLLLFAAQFGFSQPTFQFPDTITMSHTCEQGSFVDAQLMSGNCWVTFPNSHEVYYLGEYDQDPVWIVNHYEGCFAGEQFHGYYVIFPEKAYIWVSLDIGCILIYGDSFGIRPDCYQD